MGFTDMNRDEEPVSQINVVPLVDVILVVLIIFMVTAPLLMNSSIPVNLPKAKTGEGTENSNLRLILTKEGKVYMNGSLISQDELVEATKKWITKNPQIQVILSADQATPHGLVIKTIDTLRSLGVTRFAIGIDNADEGNREGPQK